MSRLPTSPVWASGVTALQTLFGHHRIRLEAAGLQDPAERILEVFQLLANGGDPTPLFNTLAEKRMSETAAALQQAHEVHSRGAYLATHEDDPALVTGPIVVHPGSGLETTIRL